MRQPRKPLVAVLFVVAITWAGVSPIRGSDRLPNIVFMFADDLGYGDLRCYGHPYARTPALDHLASQGTRFTQFYVTGVTCNPSRTGVMTGRFPARFAKYPADFGLGDRLTVTELLQKQGYQTGHFGKWHLGPESSPGTYGLGTIEVIGKSKGPQAGRDDDLYGRAIDFIRANQDRPFYVQIWGHATHYPVNTPANLVEPFAGISVDPNDFSGVMHAKFDQCRQAGGDLDSSMQQYLGDVLQIDRNVGRVMATLDELGLRDNTIVVFSSDHGPAPVRLTKQGIREFSQNMLGSPGPFRGGKHEQLEGGIRVPMILRWPGVVAEGRVNDAHVGSMVDWLPTLASIAGVSDLPPDLDGEDLSDIWRGADRPRRRPLFWKVSAPGAAPAIRDGRWKLHLNRRRRGGPELYDLLSDPGETQNLAAEQPQRVNQLRQQIERWVAELPEDYEKLGKRNRRQED